MARRARSAVVVVVVALAIVGCGETRHYTLSSGDALLTGADFRAITVTRAADGSTRGRVNPEYIRCAEPSPDVAKAVGRSLNVGGSASVAGLPSGIDPKVAFAISSAHAQAIAQLTERLATIQLLRDGLHSACEAYANGAISDTTYAIMLSRFDKLMVTMLLGEIAGGAFGRTLATVSAGGGGGTSALVDLLDRQDKAQAADAKARQAAADKADADAKAAAAAGTPGKADADAKARHAAEAAADARRQAAALKADADAAAHAATAGAGGLPDHRNLELAKILFEMQRKYLENVNFDALEVACVTALDRGTGTAFADYCRGGILPKLQEVKLAILTEYLERAKAQRKLAEQWDSVDKSAAEIERYLAAVARMMKQLDQVRPAVTKTGQ